MRRILTLILLTAITACGGWKEVARGTNIGHRRILRFPEQNAAAIRVRILQSRARPHLSRISAYNHETL